MSSYVVCIAAHAIDGLFCPSCCRRADSRLTQGGLLLQATMALAFGIVAFLLGFHEKHNPLDQAVHTLQVRKHMACC